MSRDSRLATRDLRLATWGRRSTLCHMQQDCRQFAPRFAHSLRFGIQMAKRCHRLGLAAYTLYASQMSKRGILNLWQKVISSRSCVDSMLAANLTFHRIQIMITSAIFLKSINIGFLFDLLFKILEICRNSYYNIYSTTFRRRRRRHLKKCIYVYTYIYFMIQLLLLTSHD